MPQVTISFLSNILTYIYYLEGQAANGDTVILKFAGKDATEAYSEVHSMAVIRENLALDKFKGNLDRSTITEAWTASTKPKAPTTVSEGKPPLHEIINL